MLISCDASPVESQHASGAGDTVKRLAQESDNQVKQIQQSVAANKQKVTLCDGRSVSSYGVQKRQLCRPLAAQSCSVGDLRSILSRGCGSSLDGLLLAFTFRFLSARAFCPEPMNAG